MATQRQISSLRALRAALRSTWTPEDIVALRQFLLASQEFAERFRRTFRYVATA